MKIRTNTAIRFKIIDIINQRSWLFMALSTTILAIATVWYVGFSFIEKSI